MAGKGEKGEKRAFRPLTAEDWVVDVPATLENVSATLDSPRDEAGSKNAQEPHRFEPVRVGNDGGVGAS